MQDAAPGAAARERHPPGLAVLSATELAERFSYYGMTALLALYMTKQLLLPGHAEHVWGLEALRNMFEWRGPLSNMAFASLIYGWYGGLVYLTPILGGLIADRWLGKTRAVTIGALLMAAGHLAMSFDQSFLVALLLLILGSGLLKGNISAQVGTLYPPDAEGRRARGFTIFSTAINIGSVAGPLASGGLAASYGWHAGFALAAAIMLVALAVYLWGRRLLPPSEIRTRSSEQERLQPEERRRAWALVAVIALNIPPMIAYMMIWSIGILWIDERVSLASPFGTVPASWFNSVDSFSSILVAAPLVALCAVQARRGTEPSSLTKMAIGFAITGLSALLLAAGSLAAGPDSKVSVLWALGCYFGMGAAFMWYWPITLALVSQAAPARINSTMVSGAFLALFVGSVLMGWVGSFYEELGSVAFWSLDAAIGVGGAMLVMLLRRPLERALKAG